MKIELRALCKGKVQGVFFRSAIKDYADKLKLVGYAQNLSDGSVLIKAIGEKQQLESFLENIQKKPGFGKIEEIDISYVKPNEVYRNFSVL